DVKPVQTPGSQSVVAGQTVSIRCQTSSSVEYEAKKWLHWYLQKPGEAPKLLIYLATGRQSGVPDRFSGRASSVTDYTLTISGVLAEDSGFSCLGFSCVHSGFKTKLLKKCTKSLSH
uniref:Ig-like domain-containing protein n=1 Tax=Seriola lalandi dorsalis TaxID=1841481 RepID=A0A3B4XAL6_SERLL